jgi:DNA-binding response OmpR family regulator
MTGVPESLGARFGMERGADVYLAKAFEMQALLAEVHARLERQQAIEAHSKVNEKTLLEILSTTPDLVAIVAADSDPLLYLNTSGRQMLAVGPTDEISELRLGDFHADTETDLAHQEKSPEPSATATGSGRAPSSTASAGACRSRSRFWRTVRPTGR